MTASPVDTTTDLHAVIAALQAERDAGLAREAVLTEELTARTAELVERKTEFDERIEYQAATNDVLKAMSASPDDPQPVFDLIVERARDLCDAYGATVYEFDGTLIHYRAATGVSDDPTVRAAIKSMFPMLPTREWAAGRAILDRQIIRIDDIQSEPGLNSTIRGGTAKSALLIPLMRGDTVFGALALGSRERGGLSDSQAELLKTFAEQAVIAITSAQTYRALQTRTSDLQESLAYQTATSDVLKVISRSTFDLQPVLDTVVEIACRLCDADQALISRRSGELWRMEANRGFPPEYEEYNRVRGAFRFEPDSPSVAARTAREGRVVHIEDVAAVPGYPEAFFRLGKHRTSLGVPLLRNGETVGLIQLARQRVEPFTNHQIELVSTFADQAVIAIENTRLMTEQREALEQQTATADVLGVINSSPGDLAPVFDAMLEKAMRLSGAAYGVLRSYNGEHMHMLASRGVPTEYAEFLARSGGTGTPGDSPMPGTAPMRALETRQPTQRLDVRESIGYTSGIPGTRAIADLGGARTCLHVPLVKDQVSVGLLTFYRQEVRAFSDKQIALLQNFAAQAVIAMENARLLTEQREALEQQTATAEVLQVINASPGNLAPVFDAILEKAHKLCEVGCGSLHLFEGETGRAVAVRGLSDAYANRLRQGYGVSEHLVTRQLLAGKRFVQFANAADVDISLIRTGAEIEGIRTVMFMPLRKDEVLLGMIVSSRREVRLFSDKEIELLQNFATQAVIAMESARLLNELRTRTDELAQRQAELRITFENMGDGVAMFDETQHLVAWNRKFQDILDAPDEALAARPTFVEYIRYLTERGEFGQGAEQEEQVRRIQATRGRATVFERTRPNGRVIEVRHNPVPGGGFVLIYADITERKRSEAEIRAARDAAEEASRTIEAAYRELKTAQANLIQAEKMASLGQLTAGIAHEIKNPLNFVNNFAALSVDLLSELKETAAPGFAALTHDQRAEIDDVSAMLTSNLEKITEHGKRADGIVKAMLEHSRGSSGERRMVDLNALIDEALNLVYHGARAQDQSFNITLERDFGEGIAAIEVNPQDITRVFLNIFSNGFYAATRRARNGGDTGFAPTLKVTTRDAGEAVEIRVRDNGAGIPADIRDKLFQPFFTTKPTGEGTGLGLSITYDIVTQQHGGNIAVDSKVGDYSEFTIRLPRNL